MTAGVGQELLHYRLIEKLGEGGMGVVWRATDTTLDREVAVKILPEAFSLDIDRLARFEREAKLLASLNHPNIAAVYGLHECGGLHFLAMELVPGEDLSQRLARGRVQIEEALAISVQIAEALEAAHEQGVIHRDLKPANVRLTPDGKAKVLDFGLAKALSAEPGLSSGDPSHSPTITSAGTLAGVILGTAGYMSPEQAKGYGVDRRADIWAFGVVMYEMLSGRQTFAGETVSETLASVLKDDIDESTLPAETPTTLRQLLERCLRKDPKKRLRDMGDGRLVLEEVLAAREWTLERTDEGSVAPGARRSPGLLVLLLLAGIVLGSIVMFFVRSPAPEPLTVSRMSILAGASSAPFPVVSPDGSAIIYPGEEGGVYLRQLDSFEETLVRGTEDPVSFARFSFDGRWIVFVRDATPAELLKVPIDGSAPPVQVATLPPAASVLAGGLVWTSRDELVTVTGMPYTVWKTSAEGGTEPSLVPISEEIAESQVVITDVLPDGRHLLGFADAYGGTDWQTHIVIIDSDTGEARILLEDGFVPRWSPTGHLVFTRGDTLHAVAFDEQRLEVMGGPVALIAGLRGGLAPGGFFSLSREGTLAYRPGGERGRDQLALLDVEGNLTPWSGERRDLFGSPVVSDDGSMLAVSTLNLDEGLNEIWISEVERPRLRPFADEPATDCVGPILTPNGDEMFFGCFSAGGSGGVYRRRTDGSTAAELLMERDGEGSYLLPTSVSPDGRWLLVLRFGRSRDDAALYRLSLESDGTGSSEPAPFAVSQIDLDINSGVYLSPDGRWAAHESSQGGRTEIFVRSFSANGEFGPAVQVSPDGGLAPRWIRGQRGGPLELSYRRDDDLMVVSIETSPRLRIGDPRVVTGLGHLEIRLGDRLPDGRWLVNQRLAEGGEASEIRVVLNWFEELK